MTPRTIDECYRKLGLTHRPTHLEMVTTEKLKEMVRKAWNFATAAERERQRETTNDDAAISELADDIAALALNSDVTNEAGETLSVREVVGRYLRPVEVEIECLRGLAIRAWHSFRRGLTATGGCRDGLTDGDILELVRLSDHPPA
jgi:hypothetical protein